MTYPIHLLLWYQLYQTSRPLGPPAITHVQLRKRWQICETISKALFTLAIPGMVFVPARKPIRLAVSSEQTRHKLFTLVTGSICAAILKIAASSFIYFRNDSDHTTVANGTKSYPIQDVTLFRHSGAPTQKLYRNRRFVFEQKSYPVQKLSPKMWTRPSSHRLRDNWKGINGSPRFNTHFLIGSCASVSRHNCCRFRSNSVLDKKESLYMYRTQQK